MGVLILSPDSEAGSFLCSALTRLGVPHEWRRRLEAPQGAPSVLVIDSKLRGYGNAIRDLRATAPWQRTYLLADTNHESTVDGTWVVYKPFDAAGLAQALQRDLELVEVERRERLARASAQELALLVQSSFEALIGLDAEFHVLSWNRGAVEIYGYSESEALGRKLEALLGDPSFKPCPFGSETRSVEVDRRSRDGKHLTVLLSRFRASPGEKSRLQYVEVSLDVTHKRALEAELAHSQRLAHLGRIAATMSHEINNPLAIIRSCAAWIAELSRQNPELEETAEDLEVASERIAKFVDQMCGFARRTPADLKPRAFLETLQLALRMVRPRAAHHRVSVSTCFEGAGDLMVPHDPTRLAQAFINLLSNAIDAAAEGGKTVDCCLLVTDIDVTLVIEDDGPGIADEIRDRLFQPFATTKPYGQGTGLGLSLTQEIAQEHGGTITLRPRESAGTLAELRIPRVLGLELPT